MSIVKSAATPGAAMPRRLLLAYVLAWLVEGALRKWAFPALEQPLYFLRVVIVACAVAYALRRLPERVPGPALAGLGGTLAVLCFSAAHVIRDDQTFMQAILGSRLVVELFLMPLALGPWLRPQQAVAVYRLIVAATLPITFLAVAQVLSPASAPINRIFADGGAGNFVNYGGVVRATGVFSSSAGHVGFVMLAVACALALALTHGKTTRDRVMLTVVFPLLLILVFTSGSRSAIYGAGFIVVIAIPLIALRRPSFIPRLLAGGTVIGCIGWKVIPILAPDAVTALMMRLFGAGMQDEAGGRLTGGFVSWVPLVDAAPTFGLGLGATARGLGNLSNQQVLTEAELEQWIMQLGPAIFTLALLLRFSAIVYLLKNGVEAIRNGDAAAAPILGAGLWAWLLGPITDQGSVNGYAVVTALLVLCYRNQQNATQATSGQSLTTHVQLQV